VKWTEWFYNILVHLGLPVAVAGSYYGFRGRDAHTHTARKFGTVSSRHLEAPVSLWLHGASVGEAGLINQLLDWTDDLGVNQNKIFVTTQTLSGLDRIDHHRKELLPADYPALIGPLIGRVNADTLAVLETEIWPNLFRQHPNNLLLLNARMSDATQETYFKIRPLIRHSLNYSDTILARTEADRKRFQEYVSVESALELGGNLKWTRCLDPPEPSSYFVSGTKEPSVVVLGSTREGEEELLLEVLDGFDCRIVLAPRHLDRIGDVREILRDFQLRWICSSEIESSEKITSEYDVVLLDEFGRLEAAYGSADLALVGGGWSENGGHNPLEAAQYGVPVIVGSDMSNFRESTQFLDDLGILTTADRRGSLRRTMREKLNEQSDEHRTVRLEKLHDRIEPIRERYVSVLEKSLSPDTGGNQS